MKKIYVFIAILVLLINIQNSIASEPITEKHTYINRTQETYFDSYAKNLEKQIEKNWQPPLSSKNLPAKAYLYVIKNNVIKNGETSTFDIVTSSIKNDFDTNVINALVKTKKLELLPNEFKGEIVKFELEFNKTVSVLKTEEIKDPKIISDIYTKIADHNNDNCKYSQAIQLYSKALEFDLEKNNEYDIYMGRAKAYYKNKEYNLAKQDLAKIKNQLNNDIYSDYDIYPILYGPEKAIEKLTEEVNGLGVNNSYFRNFQWTIIFIYEHLGNYEKAIEYINRVTFQKASKIDEMWSQRNSIAISDVNNVIKNITIAIENNKNNDIYYYYRSILYFNQYESKRDALYTLRYAELQYNFEKINYIERINNIELSTQNELEKAIIDIKLAISLNPNKHEYYDILSQYYYETNETNKIKKEIKEVTKQINKNKNSKETCWLYYYRALLYQKQEPKVLYRRGNKILTLPTNEKRIRKDLINAIELNPNEEIFYKKLSETFSDYKLTGNIKKIDEITKLINKYNNKNTCWLYSARGLIMLYTTHNSQEINDFQKAIELKPDEPEFYLWLICCVNYLNRPAIIDEVTKKIEDNNNNYNKSWLYYYRANLHAGDLLGKEMALADIKKAIELNPHETAFYRLLEFIKKRIDELKKKETKTAIPELPELHIIK